MGVNWIFFNDFQRYIFDSINSDHKKKRLRLRFPSLGRILIIIYFWLNRFNGMKQMRGVNWEEWVLRHWDFRLICLQWELNWQFKTISVIIKCNCLWQLRFKYIFSVGENYWLSATDKDRKSGDFAWSDNTPVDSRLWASGYPKEFKEDEERDAAVILDANNFKLKDQLTQKKSIFFCELSREFKECLWKH